MVSHSSLHHALIKGIIDKGYAPSNVELAELLDAQVSEIEKALIHLQDYHGVVLHPNDTKVWAIHPFSLSPTNFYVTSSKGEWWGNCAWCSLGIAALVKDDVKITTTLGAEKQQVEINIIDGTIQEKDYFVHFPIKMKEAWDNVIYTCSTMLLFKNEESVDVWCEKHNIPKGDIQPIEKIWNFSKKWYGNHLKEDWIKWTMDEARDMFREFQLNHPIWDLGSSNERF